MASPRSSPPLRDVLTLPWRLASAGTHVTLGTLVDRSPGELAGRLPLRGRKPVETGS